MKTIKKTPPQNPGQSRSRVALYVRVSTEEQAQYGYSIKGQLEKLDMACKLYNWEPLPPYVDEGFSGKDLNRPEVKRLIRDARAQRFDLVLVYKLDRLSRRLSDLMALHEQFEQWNVGIRSATEPFDTTNSAGKLLFNMLGSFAQFEREMIIDRTKMGLRRRLMEGKWNTLAPFGYRIKADGTLEINPEEYSIARKVFVLFLNENLGAKMIARQLRKEDNTTRRKNAWAKNSVWNMLRNPVYAGMYQIDGNLSPAPHKGIISKEEFEQVQSRLAGKIPSNARAQMSPNILSGLTKCGLCGSVLTVGKGKGNYYYVCSGRIGDRGCQLAWIPARPLEEAVLNEIRSVAAQPDLINESLEELKTRTHSEEKSLRSEHLSLIKQLEGLEKTKDTKVRWMLETLPKGEVAEEIRKEIQNQIEQIKSMKLRQQDIDGRIQSIATESIEKEVVAEFLERFTDSFEGLENGQKRLLIQSLVKEVVVTGKENCNLILALQLPHKPQPPQEGKKDSPPDEDCPVNIAWQPVPDDLSVHRSALYGVANGT